MSAHTITITLVEIWRHNATSFGEWKAGVKIKLNLIKKYILKKVINELLKNCKVKGKLKLEIEKVKRRNAIIT